MCVFNDFNGLQVFVCFHGLEGKQDKAGLVFFLGCRAFPGFPVFPCIPICAGNLGLPDFPVLPRGIPIALQAILMPDLGCVFLFAS